MIEISPQDTAYLADEVYSIFDERRLRIVCAKLKVKHVAASSSNKLIDGVTGGYFLKKRDTFAISIVIQNGTAKELVFVFRGTIFKRMHDLLTNASTGVRVGQTGRRVHVGFDQVFSTVRDDIKARITKETDIFQVHFIGHSLGGAVATLAADWMRSGIKSHRAKLYTFGSPRVGTHDFAQNFTKRLPQQHQYRVFHETDPIPMIPIFPFVHTPLPGKGYLIESNEFPLFAAHSMENYITSVSKHESWKTLERHLPTFNRVEAIKHFIKSKGHDVLGDALVARKFTNALAWAISSMVEKSLVKWNTRLFVGSTLVDTMARAFHTGINVEDELRMWLELLLRKLAKALNIKIGDTVKELTIGVIKYIFDSLVARLNELVRKSISYLQNVM